MCLLSEIYVKRDREATTNEEAVRAEMAYASQSESEHDRVLWRRDKRRIRLGGDSGTEWFCHGGTTRRCSPPRRGASQDCRLEHAPLKQAQEADPYLFWASIFRAAEAFVIF